jgi:hypothetical protein
VIISIGKHTPQYKIITKTMHYYSMMMSLLLLFIGVGTQATTVQQPTKAPYTPIVYVPASGIKTMHEGPRIGGVNEFSLKEVDKLSGMDGTAYWYVVGIVVPIVVIAISVPIWCCSLCCVGKMCCKAQHSSKNTALLIFVIGTGTSIIGWLLGIVASGIATGGLNAFVSGIRGVQGLGQTIIESSLGTKVYTTAMNAQADVMDGECNNNPTVPFPGQKIKSQVASIDALVGATNSDKGMVGQIKKFVDLMDDILARTVQYIDWQSYVIISSMSVIAAIVAIFMVATVLRVMDNTPEKCQPVARVTGKSSAVVVFCCGMLVMAICWVLVCVIHFLATFSSDLCVPSPNYQIDRLFYENTKYTFKIPFGRRVLGMAYDDDGGDGRNTGGDYLTPSQEDVQQANQHHQHEMTVSNSLLRGVRRLQGTTASPTASATGCDDPKFRSSMFGMLCYYQDCIGQNDWLLGLANPIKAQSTETADELDTFKANVAAVGGTLTPECSADIASFQNKTRGVNSLVDDSVGVVACYRVNPIYAAFMYDGFCNGLVNGLYFLYVAMIIGCVFLMLAMSVYRAFDFGSYQEGRKPDEWVEEGQVYSAPPMSNGAPVVATAVKVDAA